MRPPADDETVAAANVFRTSTPIALDEVAYVLGHMYKIVFLKEGAGGLGLLAHQYDYNKSTWEPFNADLWDHQRAEGPAQETESGLANVDWYDRCAGCHTTGYNREKRTFAEASVACESCHGPGAKHAETQRRDDIVNPAVLPEQLGVFVCAQCHARGRGINTDSPYPVGYVPGGDLSEMFVFDKPVPGRTTDLFWETGAARQHHAQYNEFSQSKHFQNGVLCFDCHEVHRFRNVESPSRKTRLMAHTERFFVWKRSHFVCLRCHLADDLGYRRFVIGTGGTYVDQHTNHPAVIRMSTLPESRMESPKELNCSDCHMPEMESKHSGYEIHSHRFLRDRPGNLGGGDLPNACLNCHTQESKRWVEEWLTKWARNATE
jgi:hypothetical protein